MKDLKIEKAPKNLDAFYLLYLLRRFFESKDFILLDSKISRREDGEILLAKYNSPAKQKLLVSAFVNGKIDMAFNFENKKEVHLAERFEINLLNKIQNL